MNEGAAPWIVLGLVLAWGVARWGWRHFERRVTAKLADRAQRHRPRRSPAPAESPWARGTCDRPWSRSELDELMVQDPAAFWALMRRSPDLYRWYFHRHWSSYDVL